MDNQLANWQTGVSDRWTETHETDYGVFGWSKWGPVLASFVLFHSVKPLKVSFVSGKSATRGDKHATESWENNYKWWKQGRQQQISPWPLLVAFMAFIYVPS